MLVPRTSQFSKNQRFFDEPQKSEHVALSIKSEISCKWFAIKRRQFSSIQDSTVRGKKNVTRGFRSNSEMRIAIIVKLEYVYFTLSRTLALNLQKCFSSQLEKQTLFANYWTSQKQHFGTFWKSANVQL